MQIYEANTFSLFSVIAMLLYYQSPFLLQKRTYWNPENNAQILSSAKE